VRIRIIVVGKLKERFILDGEKGYLKRTRPYSKLEVVEITASAPKEGKGAQSIAEEGVKILGKLKAGEIVVALDEKGKGLTSPQFASFFEEHMNSGRSDFAFVIGGAFGLSKEVRDRADMVLSLSDMTFPYQLCRLILVEQIYRAMSIVHGLPYHKV
jgi:23S rRNA (pseudouridine1915-N3)-methyltransferase